MDVFALGQEAPNIKNAGGIPRPVTAPFKKGSWSICTTE